MPVPLTLECGGRLRMLALVRVHKQGQLPKLPLDVLYRSIKPQVQLLVWVQFEGPQDPATRSSQSMLYPAGEDGNVWPGRYAYLLTSLSLSTSLTSEKNSCKTYERACWASTQICGAWCMGSMVCSCMMT